MNPAQMLCGALILLEISAFVTLFQGPQEHAVSLFLCVHLGVSVMLAMITAQRTCGPAATSYAQDCASFFFFAAIGFLVPLIGSCICLAAIGRQRHRLTEHDSIEVTLTASPVLPDGLPATTSPRRSLFAESDISGVLKHSEQKERRLAALIAARDLPVPHANNVIRLALTDSEDEVRLLAYTMLSVQEEELQARIQTLTDQLAAVAPECRLLLHRALAHTYWEMVYKGLTAGVIESFMLEAAREHVDAAQQEAPRDASLRLLLGRIFIRQGNLDQAAMAFNQAKELGIDSQKIVPFLQEISFLQSRTRNLRSSVFNEPRPLQSVLAVVEAAEETSAYASHGAAS